MAAMWGAIAGGAASLLGSVYSSNKSAQQSGSINQETQDFLERMRRTAYPATVSSMKDAGLNPMLAYSQGPIQTGSYSAQKPDVKDAGAAIAGGMNSAGAAMLSTKQSQNVDAQRALTEAETLRALASAGQMDAQRDSIRQEMTAFPERMRKLGFEADAAGWKSKYEQFAAGKMNSEDLASARYYTARAQEMEFKAKILGLQIPEAVSQAAMWASEFGKKLPYIERGLGAIGSAGRAAGAAKGGFFGIKP